MNSHDQADGAPRDRAPRSGRRVGWLAPAVAAFALGGVATIIATSRASETAGREARIEFEAAADAAFIRLSQALDVNTAVTQDAAALFAGSSAVSREEWRDYVEVIDIPRRFPGLYGLGFVERAANPAELQSLVDDVHQTGMTSFEIKRPPDATIDNSDGPFYIIRYLEPADRNTAAIGLDVAGRVENRDGYDAAMWSGRSAFTAPVRLVQSTGTTHGLIVVHPIYDRSSPIETPEDREAALTGWITSPMNVETMAIAATTATYGVDLTVVDVSATESITLADTGKALRESTVEGQPRHFHSKSVEFGSRTLAFTAVPYAADAFLPDHRIATWTSVAGGLATLLITSFIASLGRARDAASRESRRFARENDSLRAAMDGHAVLATIQPEGRITEVNSALARALNTPASELVGDDVRDHVPAVASEILAAAAEGRPWRGESAAGRTTTGDGATRTWLELAAMPVHGDQGQHLQTLLFGFDVTDRHRAETANRVMAAAVDRSPDAMVLAELDGRVRFGNPAAEELDASLNHELRPGGPTLLMMAERVGANAFQRVYEDIRRTERHSSEVEVRDPDGGPSRWLQLSGSPVKAADGTIEAVMLVKREITEQVEAKQRLSEARDAAEAASLAKSNFLANMSHEIRTPMTAILGFSDIIGEDAGDDQDPAAVADAIRTIRSNAAHLLTIINDILDVSKIEAGQMTVEAIDTDVVTIVGEVAELIRPRAEGKGVALTVEWPETMPDRITCDPTRFRQILLNLCGNAIKFTEVGTVTLQVTCDADAERLSIAVRDTGIGMSPAQRDRIAAFEAFSQADSSMTRRFGGSGLGLRISNALAELLGGGISVESTEGEGSTFTASVATGSLTDRAMIEPAAPSPPSAPSAADTPVARIDGATSAAPDAPPLEGLHILLAEDGPDNQRLISFLLRKAGAEVTVCDNGLIAAQAIEAAGDGELPNLILMDMQMPELDGYGATRRLRDGGFTLPIVALTAHAMDGDRERCMDAGCDDFQTKPIDRAALIDVCRQWASRHDDDRRDSFAKAA